MSGKRKQSRRRNKPQARMVYAVSILTLTALVGMAFFSPGWFFGIQDSVRCSDTVLEERENVDVAVLSTNYESSFYQRMINFAENQDGSTHYYVASEELTDTAGLQDFLYSDNGLYNDRILALLEAGLITDRIFQCQVTAWKQYVIYSDDYAKGVNFILWYIELENPDESIGTYKLLLEANTGELYGLRADTGATIPEYSYSEHSLEEFLGVTAEDILDEEGWMILAYLYSGLTESNFFQYYDLYHNAVGSIYGYTTDFAGMEIGDAAFSELRLKLGVADEEEEQWLDFLRIHPTMLVWDGGNRLEYTFPYGEGRLIFRMQMPESVYYPWKIRNITVGFPAIYELIPEFQAEEESRSQE
ncbi:MAG: hypothetical protein NC420_04405 [Eubacterium sp.]|nr:hypothetical protein [Eubacterium sp.]MCM1216157.1 hypothetical protein [Lachnospiraceae bacterium]MCM1304540.1 hypothetical protein [Butyrivibrio sp.]MCM1344185.1 hypothetical protein [Muribaculaceae bacterium]MCM1239071.1 hypothetical protein [Lachnospiraceae bacterium]